MLRQVDEHAPEAVVISIRTAVITTMATIAIARRLRVDYLEMGIVVISDRVDGFALELLRGGASRTAYLIDERLPNMDTVLDSLRQVRAGQSVLDPALVDSLVPRRSNDAIEDLTLGEVEVLEQMAHGPSNTAIANALCVSVRPSKRVSPPYIASSI